MLPSEDDDTSALEQAKKRLYEVRGDTPESRRPLSVAGDRILPHVWEEPISTPQKMTQAQPKKRHLKLAAMFFGGALLFFIVCLGAAGYYFYFGANSVSVANIDIKIIGPNTIAGGDTVPLQLTITNKNPVAVENALLEVAFPEGTRDATDVLKTYPYYSENVGTLPSGATITRPLKAVIFGGAGQTLSLPISFTFGMAGSNSKLVKKTSYPLAISSTPLSVTIDTLSETVSGKPLTLTLTVRSNAAIPLTNAVLVSTFPFGFIPTSSSIPLSNSSFLLGTLAPGAVKTVTLTGTLAGQDREQRVFHFSVGTANAPQDQNLAVTYMTQDATVTIAAPFINTSISINGDSSANTVLPAGSRQSVTVSYANTLPTSISNVAVSVAISGSAVDYDSIETTSGFYSSQDHTVIFSQDTDPALASLAPGASGIGTFTFSTVSAGSLPSNPQVDLTTSVSGTRIGETNVPQTVSASATKTAKVGAGVVFSATALHSSGPLANTGPVPPVANQSTTYTVVWNVQNQGGGTIADGIVSATLPSYVTYTNKTSGSGVFSYDSSSRTVSWNAGNLAKGATTQGMFQVSLTPSVSQKGDAPKLTGSASFTGHDRFAGVKVDATTEGATTETPSDPGYLPSNSSVQ